MNTIKKLILLAGVSGFSTLAFSEDQLRDIFDNGSLDGNIRAYYNTREYEDRTDESAFSLGGALRAETGKIGPIKIGAGYYTAQDLGTNDDDPNKVNSRLGSDLEVLGEAYLKFDAGHTVATLGRQKVNTPFANSGDAFMIPFTFHGYGVTNKSLKDISFEANYLSEIKNRNSETFVDIGSWTASRYGASAPSETGSMANLGAVYGAGPIKLEAWFTRVSEFFDTLYVNGSYSASISNSVKPFVGAQYATQRESGDEILGRIDSSLYGVKFGTTMGSSKVTLAYNSVATEQSAFRNGAFLAPFSYSTSPLYTNNMLETLENVDAGEALKVTFNHSFSSKVDVKLSYATFDFDQAPDREATDLDVIYALDQYLEGLSFRWRLELVTSDVDSVEQINHRFQTQFTF
ncbi:OprD family outer membrane porin [Microbulbifer rhizosphaerae]|uniref:Outer membrane porin, OprD family n=1 Tax=Microbulbifer rhizosphaerae TaxID=1562603 RepID=A0A7W4WBG2_9GAMM|nr:OprD family outer membrane porin [Microbulbifer rhizosphaerae]MBB3061160.1 hypothetical protein [Microbulbifer rhizosphaerae]